MRGLTGSADSKRHYMEEKENEMQDIAIYKKELSFSTLTVSVMRLGRDCHLTVWGGESPHIGCTVLAVPRESLRGDGRQSCTASVLNVTGHKDEQICRYLAEETAKHCGAVVVCTGGFHMDHITKEQIRETLDAAGELAEEIKEGLKRGDVI